MKENQVEEILLNIDDIEVSSQIYARLLETDWSFFRNTFGTDFGETFMSFTNLISKYSFTGEPYKVTDDSKNLNESV